MSRSQLELITSVGLFCVVVGILIAVLLPAGSLGPSDGRLRSLTEEQSWVVHGILFTCLGLALGLRMAASSAGRIAATWLLAALLLILAFATLSEVAQIQIDGRNAAIGDWTADLIGTICGLTLAAQFGPPIINRLLTARSS